MARQNSKKHGYYVLMLVSLVGTEALAADPPAQPPPQLPPMSQVEFGKLLVTQRCANCHAVAIGQDRYAAPLHDLFGRKAGSLKGYTYSSNIKNLNIAWSVSTLNDWLTQTTFDTPDIRMRHVGIPKQDQREAILAFLKTLQGNAPSDQK